MGISDLLKFKNQFGISKSLKLFMLVFNVLQLESDFLLPNGFGV